MVQTGIRVFTGNRSAQQSAAARRERAYHEAMTKLLVYHELERNTTNSNLGTPPLSHILRDLNSYSRPPSECLGGNDCCKTTRGKFHPTCTSPKKSNSNLHKNSNFIPGFFYKFFFVRLSMRVGRNIERPSPVGSAAWARETVMTTISAWGSLSAAQTRATCRYG